MNYQPAQRIGHSRRHDQQPADIYQRRSIRQTPRRSCRWALPGPSAINQSLSEESAGQGLTNTSLGIQRRSAGRRWWTWRLKWQLRGDIGQQHDINLVPYGSKLLPQNQDSDHGQVLADNFFRRPGLRIDSVSGLRWDVELHSLQTQLTHGSRTISSSGVAWTWSKALDFTEADQGTVGDVSLADVWNYGLAGYESRQVLAINYVLDLPGVTRFTNNALIARRLRWLAACGTTRVVTGAPLILEDGHVGWQLQQQLSARAISSMAPLSSAAATVAARWS